MKGFHHLKEPFKVFPLEGGDYWVVLTNGLVPDDATGVILRATNKWWIGKQSVAVRKRGSDTDLSQYTLLSSRAYTYLYCPLHNGCFEVCIKDARPNIAKQYYPWKGEGLTVKVEIMGWTDEAVQYIDLDTTTGLSHSAGWGTTWRIPGVPGGDLGVIVLAYNADLQTGKGFCIRHPDSEDNHLGKWNHDYGLHSMHLGCGSESTNFMYAICACKDGTIEIGYKEASPGILIRPIAYITEPVRMFRDCVEIELGRGDQIYLPSNPDVTDALFWLHNCNGQRSLYVGESGGYVPMESAISGSCAIEDGKIDIYAGHEKCRLYIHGYCAEDGGEPPPPKKHIVMGAIVLEDEMIDLTGKSLGLFNENGLCIASARITQWDSEWGMYVTEPTPIEDGDNF